MKQFLLNVITVLCFPLLTFGQADCFEPVNSSFWELAPGFLWDEEPFTNLDGTLDAGVACALEELVSCPGSISSDKTTVEFSVSTGMEACAIYCQVNAGGSISPQEQAQAVQNAIAVANAGAPTCPETGEPMVVVGIDFSSNFTSGDCNPVCPTYFVQMMVNFACCEPPTDCQASFEISQSSEDCTISLFNTSTPSSVNDCGDCINPSGIASARWSVLKYYDGPLPYVSPFTGSDEFHFTFDPADAGTGFDGFQVCLTIEDCVGCTSRHCELITKFAACKGLQTEKTDRREGKESKVELEPTAIGYLMSPNPVSSELNIQINGQGEFAQRSLELYNLQGRLIKQIRLDNDANLSIDTSDLATGTYVASIRVDGRVSYSQKIVVAK